MVVFARRHYMGRLPPAPAMALLAASAVLSEGSGRVRPAARPAFKSSEGLQGFSKFKQTDGRSRPVFLSPPNKHNGRDLNLTPPSTRDHFPLPTNIKVATSIFHFALTASRTPKTETSGRPTASNIASSKFFSFSKKRKDLFLVIFSYYFQVVFAISFSTNVFWMFAWKISS